MANTSARSGMPHLNETSTVEHERGSMNDVRLRAYSLYEARGRQDGHALDDWLQAEQQVLRRAAERSEDAPRSAQLYPFPGKGQRISF